MDRKSVIRKAGVKTAAGKSARTVIWLICSVSIPLLASTSTTWAQDKKAESKQRTLKEVIVTAEEKRALNIQRVPISVTAFSGGVLRRRQITGIAQIANYTPNLQFTAGASGMPNSVNFFIRGIGQNDFITTTEPGVGLYLNGVYLARVTGAAIDMADIKSVEVLRGPQGTLFGRNTIGGAVNIITREPSDKFSGEASITGGNQHTFDANFMLNGAVIPGKLAARASFYSHSTSGWGTNIWPKATQRHLGENHTNAASAQLLFTPTSNLSFLASFDYTQSRGTSVPIGLVAFTPSPASIAYNATAAVPIGPQYITHNPNHIQIDTPPQTRMDVRGISLTSTWKGNNINFKSITAYRAQNGVTNGDYDGTPAPYLQQVVNLGQWQFSQEFRLYGAAFGDKLKWLTGLYYFQETGRFDSYVSIAAVPVEIYTNNTTHSYAAYGQATYDITGKLSITAGARLTRTAKTVRAMTNYAVFTLLPETERSASWSNFSPMGSIQYQLTQNIMAYASVTRGFRSGGFNGRPFSLSDLTPFLPETVTAYETGVKSELFRHRLRLDVDGFYEKYRNIQETATSRDARGNTVVVTGNAAQANIHGLELEVQALPAAGFRVYGTLGLTYDRVRPNPNFFFGAKLLPDTSKLNYSAGGSYTVPFSKEGTVTMGADYDYRSGFYPQFDETVPSYINGYGLLNARVQFTVGNWSLRFYGKNLLNKIYATFGETAGSRDTTVDFFGRTRQWGATMTYRF